MNRDTARSCLRLVAVVTILVGVILTTTTLISLFAAGSAMRDATAGMEVQLTGLVARMGLWAVLAHASIAAWGLVLFAVSPTLAQKIVE